MKEIKHILIDLDGTLTDPKQGIIRSVHYAMEKLNKPLATDTALDWMIGPPLKASLAKILNVDVNHHLAEEALLAYRERYSTIGLFENELYPNVIEALRELKSRGYNVFLATSKPTVYATKILECFEIYQYFTGIYGSEITGENSSKAMLIDKLIRTEKLHPQNCIMVGDREYDIFGAKENNIRSIAVACGYAQEGELQQAGADFYISQFSDILAILALP